VDLQNRLSAEELAGGLPDCSNVTQVFRRKHTFKRPMMAIQRIGTPSIFPAKTLYIFCGLGKSYQDIFQYVWFPVKVRLNDNNRFHRISRVVSGQELEGKVARYQLQAV
jgi:hypothetical protein